MVNHKQTAGVLYGDEICLSDLDIGGIVCGDAYVTQSVFLDKEANFDPGHVIHNQQLCQFKVLPKFQYTATKAFRKRLQRSQLKTKLTASNWATKLDHSDPLYKDLARDKKQIDEEQATNEMEAARTVGLQVGFGSVVQLKHVHSDHFLTQSKNRAALDKLAMEVALVPDGNEGSWWKVLPAEKVRSMGDPLRDGDKIMLQNVKFQDSFLYVSTAEPVCTRGTDAAETDDLDGIPKLQRLSTVSKSVHEREQIGAVLLHPSVDARYEVNAFPSSSKFHVSVFRAAAGKFSEALGSADKSDTEQRNIYGSAVCTLYLREDDCHLAFNEESGYVEWLPASAISVEATMWRVRKKELLMGGSDLQRAGSTILLEHLASGQYLAVSRDDAPERIPSGSPQHTPASPSAECVDGTALCVHLSPALHSEAVLWSLRAFTEDESERGDALADGEVAWLEVAGAPGPRGTKMAALNRLSSTPSGGGEVPQVLWLAKQRKREASCGGCRAICRSDGRPSNSEVVEVRMVYAKAAKAVDRLARCGRVLEGAREVWGDAPVCSLEAMEQNPRQAKDYINAHPLKHMPAAVLEVIDRCLCTLILACSRSASTDALKAEGPPIADHQDRLRGAGVVARTLEGLQHILSKVPSAYLHAEFPQLHRVVHLGFRLLQKACVGNEATKKILMRHLEFFNAHTMHNFGAFEATVEIYRDSVDLLMQVDFTQAWDTLSQILFKPGGKERIVIIFTNISVCKDGPIAKNQNVCVRFMEQFPSLTPTVEVRDGDVVLFDESRNVSVSMRALAAAPGGEQALLDPVATSTSSDAEFYRFYLKVLDCIVGLSIGRNAKAAEHFSAHRGRYALGYEHLLNVIASDSYPASYRARCCRLLDRLYIDCDPHLEVQHLSFTRVWSRLRTSQMPSQSEEMVGAYKYITASADSGDKLNPGELKALFLQLTREHARTNCEEVEVNRFVGAFVQLMHKLLLFGFYHTYDASINGLKADMASIIELVNPLLQLLDGRSDFCAPFGSFSADVARFEVTEKTVMVMDLKLEVVRVFRDLVAISMNTRQEEFAECWSKVLERKFAVSGWDSARVASQNQQAPEEVGQKGKKVCRLSCAMHAHSGQPAKAKPNTDDQASHRVSSAKVAPEPNFASSPLAGDRKSEGDKKNATATVQWTSEDVLEFANLQRNKHPLMDDLAPVRLGKITGTGELPEFFKVLLDLTRYKHKALKEAAIEFIFSSFSQHSTVVSMLQATYFVCDPETCKLHFDIREDVLKLVRSMRLLPSQFSNSGGLPGMESMKLNDAGRAQLLVDEVEVAERARKVEQDKARRGEAFAECFAILRKWQQLCSTSHTVSARRSHCCRRLLVNQGVDQILLQILHIPVERESPVERQLDRLVDTQLRDLFCEVYRLLGEIVRGNPRLQQGALAHMDMHLGFAKVEGLHVDGGLWAMMEGNAQAMLVQGRELIEFFLVDMLEKYDNPSPRWIDLVRSLSGSKENQVLVHSILSKRSAPTTRIVFGVLESDKAAVKKWDASVQGLAERGSPQFNAAMLSASMLDVLSRGCSGKQPSAEVFCASLLPWPIALRAVVGPDVLISGERVEVAPASRYKVKGSYLRFLHKVYVETSVKRLLEEKAKPDSGLWTYGDSEVSQCFVNCDTLMESFIGDLQLLLDRLGAADDSAVEPPTAPVDAVNAAPLSPETDARPSAAPNVGESERDELTWSVFEYVAGSVLPMLPDLYYAPEAVEAHPDAASLSETIFDALAKLQHIPFPGEWEKIEVVGESVRMRQRCWQALQAMSMQARVRQEWARHPKNQNYIASKVGAVEESEHDATEVALQRTVSAMLEQLSRDLKVSQNSLRGDMATVGLGLRQLALIMNKEAEVDMYNAETFEELGIGVPAAPRWEDFIISMLEACQDHSTKEEVLLNVLQLVRCSIYVVEPQTQNEPQGAKAKTAEQQWEAFLIQAPVKKISEPPDETLQWLQEKYDGMGATIAALRLVSHHNLAVQIEAVMLLLVLLQGGNRTIQNTVVVYLTRRRDRRFFKAIREVFDHAKVGLKDFKRVVKRVKNSQARGDASATTRGFMDSQRQTSVGFQLAEALLPNSLRLCQLLCEGQYRPFQRLMHKQAWLPSYDLLEDCLDLFEIVHTLIPDTLALNDGDMTALALQMIETISEAVQGPQLVNREAVLSSNFLASCNRLISSLVYAPIADGTPHAQVFRGEVKVSINDLKGWLKSDVLRCTLALFEACNNPRIPQLMQEFFELKKVISQMITIGRIIGLADPIERKDASLELDEDADFGFGSIVGSTGAFGSIKAGSIGSTSSSRRANNAQGSFTGHSASFVRGGNASARTQLVGSLKFAEGYEETLRGELLSFYFLLRYFKEFDESGRVKEELLELKKEHSVLYEYLDSHTFEVELVRQHARSQDPVAEKVFFAVSSDVLEVVSGSHFREHAQEVLFSVPRKNPTEKARALLFRLKKQMNRLMWVVTLARSSSSRRFIIRYREAFEEVPLFLSLGMMCLLLAFYGIPVDPHTHEVLGGGQFYGFEMETPGYETGEPYPFASETSDPSGLGATFNSIVWATDPASKFSLQLQDRWVSTKEWDYWPPARIIAVIVASLHLALSAVNITAHLFHEFPLIVWDAWDKYKRELDGQAQTASSTEKLADGEKLRPIRQGKAFLKNMREAPRAKKTRVDLRFYVLVIQNSGLLVYLSFMAIVSLLAWVMSPFFHVLYLLDFFRRKSGRLVMRSLILGAPNLLRSFWLGLVVLVCFGFFSYNYFSETINANQQMCRTPYQCVVKHLLDSMTGDLTTVLGNDLGVFAFPPMVVWADAWEQFRSLYVFVSLIFWVFLLQGIIQGQIIDAFAEMRNRADALEEDLEQKCFVSSVDRFVFNAYPGEWEKRRGGKYVFNYLLFFVNLMQKDPEDMNGLEHVVFRQFSQDSIGFMPIETFVARERERDGAHKDEDQHVIRSVQEDVRRVEQQVQALQGSMDQLLQRMPHSGSQEHRASVFSQLSGPFVMLPPERERAST